jgi:hypothetical protein
MVHPCSRILFAEVIVTLLINKFVTLCAIRKFITVFSESAAGPSSELFDSNPYPHLYDAL